MNSVALITTVLLQSMGVPDIDYYAECKSRTPCRTFARLQSEQPVSEFLKSDLQSQFLLAQKIFLQNEGPASLPLWQSLVQMAHKADWPAPERQMIHLGFLRLAQLSQNPRTENEILKHAIQFDASIGITKEQFPPEFVGRYEALRKGAAHIRVPTNKMQGFNLLLVNGSLHDLDHQETIEVPAGVQRLTWLSNRFLAVTRVIDTKLLSQLELHREPVISGDCGRPALHPAAAAQVVGSWSPRDKIRDEKKFQIVFANYCVANINTAGLVSPNPVAAENRNAQTANTAQTAVPFDLDFAVTAEKPKAFYEKPKFWLGAGALLGMVYFINQQQNRGGESPPTYREGL